MNIQCHFYDEARADLEQNERQSIAEETMRRHNDAVEKALQRLEEEARNLKTQC